MKNCISVVLYSYFQAGSSRFHSRSSKLHMGHVIFPEVPALLGWSGQTMVFYNFQCRGVRPATLDKCIVRTYCVCSRCGWGYFGILFFLSPLVSVFFLPFHAGRLDIF